MGESAPVWDAIVVGAGLAGAATALGLKGALGASGRVMLCDPALAREQTEPRSAGFRALAIAPDVQRFLTTLGVWTSIESQAQPVSRMVITDARTGLLPNQQFLGFDQADAARGPLAQLVLAEPLRRALLEACTQIGVIFDSAGCRSVSQGPWRAELTTDSGETRRCRLLVAADGGRSRLRHAARIQTLDAAYPQSAIVATLNHTLDHGGQAVQHFLPAGPIALLPLRGDGPGHHRTSLVWTVDRPEAERLVALSLDHFCAALEERVGFGLGHMILEDRPIAHPLRLMLAKTLVERRLVLVGDAARVIHPLAGQGLNLGLRDAEVLSRHVRAAVELGLDPGAPRSLEAYQRERRPASTAMAAGTDLLDRLFSNDNIGLRAVRDLGLNLVDVLTPFKRGFIRAATGDDQGRPSSSASARP